MGRHIKIVPTDRESVGTDTRRVRYRDAHANAALSKRFFFAKGQLISALIIEYTK